MRLLDELIFRFYVCELLETKTKVKSYIKYMVGKDYEQKLQESTWIQNCKCNFMKRAKLSIYISW